MAIKVAMYGFLGIATPEGVVLPWRPRRGQEGRTQLAFAGGVSFRTSLDVVGCESVELEAYVGQSLSYPHDVLDNVSWASGKV